MIYTGALGTLMIYTGALETLMICTLALGTLMIYSGALGSLMICTGALGTLMNVPCCCYAQRCQSYYYNLKAYRLLNVCILEETNGQS